MGIGKTGERKSNNGEVEIMSTGNPNYSNIKEIDMILSYNFQKDCFRLKVLWMKDKSIDCYFSADDLIELGNLFIQQGKEYKQDPEKYKEKYTTKFIKEELENEDRIKEEFK